MGTLLGLSHKAGSFYQVTQTALGGSGTSNLYGKLDRETHSATVTGGWEHIGAMVAQLGDDVYVLVCEASKTPKVYKGYDGAILVRTDGTEPATLPLSGETITQGGVTGLLVEDYKAGDDFFVVTNELGGQFAAGGVTFTSGDPMTLISREDNGGQFAIDFESAEIANTVANIQKSSGLHHGLASNNEPTLAFMFVDNTGNGDIHTVVRNPTSGLWEENDSGVNNNDQFQRCSGSVVHRNTIYWIIQKQANSRDTGVMTMNIGTGVVTFTSVTGGTNFTYPGAPFVWNGRVFYSHSTSTTATKIYEITGGAVIEVVSIPSNTASWDDDTPGTGFVGPDDNALYVPIRNSTSLNQVIRLYDDGNDIVLSCPAAARSTTVDDVGEALLPSAIRTGIATASHGHSFLDIESTVGSKEQRFWHYNGQIVGGTEFKYVEAVALDSGIAATVSGTIGNSNDLIFANSVAASLAVGDWVVLATSNSCFRVAAVSGTDVELANATTAGDPTGTAIKQPIPTAGSEVINKVQVMATESGTEGGLTGVAIPHGTVGGGHVYTVGEVSGEFTSQAAAIGGVQLTFTIFDPFSNLGAGTGKARGYFLKEDGTFGQMTLVSVGQGTKNGNINETLSSGTGQTFIWDSVSDGVPDGLFTDKFVEIFV